MTQGSGLQFPTLEEDLVSLYGVYILDRQVSTLINVEVHKLGICAITIVP